MPDLMGPGGMNLLRLAQIFGQLGNNNQNQGTLPTDLGHGGSNPMVMSAAPDVNTQAAGVPPQPSGIDALMKYQPEHQASDAFMQHIGQMPERQQYPPSGLRKVGSVIAGLGAGVKPLGIAEGSPIGFQGSPEEAMKVSNAYQDKPFTQAMGDWEQKNKPLEMAATNEKNYNLGQRQLLLGESSRIIQQQRADTYADRVRQIQDENDSKDRKRQADAKRDQDRLEVYKAASKGGELKFGDNGKAYMVYKDGSTVAVDPNLFSPQEMEELKQKGAKDLEATRETNREKLEGVRQPNRIAVKKTPSGNVTVKPVKPETGNEESRRRYNNAVKFKAEHPELSKWVTLGSNGKVDIKDPIEENEYGKVGKGPSEYEHSLIYNSIFRSRESQGDVNLPKEKIQPEEQDQEEDDSADRVVVTDLQGKTLGTIHKSEIPKLDKSRYRIK